METSIREFRLHASCDYHTPALFQRASTLGNNVQNAVKTCGCQVKDIDGCRFEDVKIKERIIFPEVGSFFGKLMTNGDGDMCNYCIR